MASSSSVTQEIKASTANGYLMFVIGLALLAGGPWLVVKNPDAPPMGWVLCAENDVQPVVNAGTLYP